jgi:hypothetical protein
VDFLRTLKKRKSKQHTARVSAASSAVGRPKRGSSGQERGAKKLLKAG